ncbi:MAG: hypothetical protein R3321_02560 [Nitrososphaeraceae archaeon]|nr:hypothetical protein [Nitrososphaeraceae archaeon]
MDLDFSKFEPIVREYPPENKVEVYIPRCKKCNDRMVKWRYRMKPDDRRLYGDLDEVTFGYSDVLMDMVFACKRHPSSNVKLNPAQLGVLMKYMSHQIIYRNFPKNV